MQKGLFNRILPGVFALLAFSAVAKADTIAITNADFTDPSSLTAGQFTDYDMEANTIPGWTNPNIAGVENFDGTGDYASGAIPSGPNAAYDDGGTIAQDLTGDGSLDLLAAGTYTLTAYGGRRTDKVWPGGSIALYTAGDVYLGSATLIQPAQGYFALTTLTLPILPTNPEIGQRLQVELISNGNSAGFDNVSLDFTAIPEPSTWVMMLAGAAGLLFSARRARRGDREA